MPPEPTPDLPDDTTLLTPDGLLRRAAAADAAHAIELLARVSGTRLLDLVVTQAELAVDVDEDRGAGIDAIADLARVAVEVMGLSQDTELDLDDDPSCPPTVTGWDLVTVAPSDLLAATLALPVGPWVLVLVAFADTPDAAGGLVRRVVAAAADGRLAAARLRLSDPEDEADVLGACVVRDADDLGEDAPLGRALAAALDAAARGG